MTVQIGLEALLSDQLHLLQGRRVGLVASPSSIDPQLVSSVERLYRCRDVKLVALFGPEHGLRGDAQAGQTVPSSVDRFTGLPVYSLYGETRKPSPAMLRALDVIVYDLQECGLRFFTYLSTLAYVMQAAAAAAVQVIVLDRPNPLTGHILEGSFPDEIHSSFVGVYPIPIRHGMTAGEIALYFNAVQNIGCDLQVVMMRGWKRTMWFDQTRLPFVPPSPNLPTLAALTAYPGTCLFEGTNVSEGRGTANPFEYIGAPWIDAEALAQALNDLELPGVRWRPVHFTPTFSKYVGEQCGGIHLYVTDREVFRPVEVTLFILSEIMQRYEDDFQFLAPSNDGGRHFIDLLSGGAKLREHLTAGRSVRTLVEEGKYDQQQFAAARFPYLRYPE
jgi:uncharacterized protein YbbC (DUF1343 family)